MCTHTQLREQKQTTKPHGDTGAGRQQKMKVDNKSNHRYSNSQKGGYFYLHNSKVLASLYGD